MVAATAPPVGENFASHAFRVRSFQAEALAALSRFGAALADCSPDSPPDLDVSDMRVPPLQQELEAVSRDEAAGIAGPPAVSGMPGAGAALSLPMDADNGRTADAGRSAEATPASSGDTAAQDGVCLLLEPPSESGPAEAMDAQEAQPQDTDERDSAAVQQPRGARTHSRSAAEPAGAGTRKRGRRAAQSSEVQEASDNDIPIADLAKSASLAAAMEELREADADGAIMAVCDELRPQGVHAVGRRLKMFLSSDESWQVGKVTHFNRRSGKHRVQFEDGSTEVKDLATEQLVFLPAAEASGAEDSDNSEEQIETKEAGVEGEKAERLRSKRSRSQAKAIARVPPPQRRALKDKGVTFHPDVALQAMEEVKRRRRERVAAAAETLASVAAMQQDAPTFKNREGNFAADAVDDAASEAALQLPSGDAEGGDADNGQVSHGEVLLRVAVSWPGNPGRIQQEWLVLSSQHLTQLRDRLYCRTDLDMKSLALDKPSGFLYVEGTFYNDMRQADAADLSETVRIFCARHSIAAPAAHEGAQEGSGYRTARMEDTTFADLWLRVGPGSGYVYCHQGCCEHMVTIRDVCLVHPDHLDARLRCPLRAHTSYTRRRECNICNTRLAAKVTYDDIHAPENPCFWCNSCYQKVHYDEAGKLQYDSFKQFQYLHE